MFNDQVAKLLNVMLLCGLDRQVSLPLQLSPYFEWSSFCMAGSGILIGTFSLSGSSAKKVTTVRSSLALLVNSSCKIYCFCKYSYLLT